MFKVINWFKLAFFLDPQLGPVNNFDLAQLITLKNRHFFALFCFNTVLKYLFCSGFEHQPKFAPKMAKKTIAFHIVQNTG